MQEMKTALAVPCLVTYGFFCYCCCYEFLLRSPGKYITFKCYLLKAASEIRNKIVSSLCKCSVGTQVLASFRKCLK